MDLVFGIELVGPRGRDVVRLSEDDVYEVLEGHMNLEPEHDISVIQMISPHPRRVDILPKCQEVWRVKDLFKFLDQHYNLRSGKKVFVHKPFEEVNIIKVKRVPIWWTKEGLERVFNAWGEVKTVKEDMFRSSRDYYNDNGISNGNYTIKMKVRSAIPSTIIIEGDKFEVYYHGQEPTCWRCGRAHYKNECGVTNKRNFINSWSLDEFPTLPLRGELMEQEGENESESVNNTEIASPTENEAAF